MLQSNIGISKMNIIFQKKNIIFKKKNIIQKSHVTLLKIELKEHN